MIEEKNTTEINVELGIDWTEKLDLKKCEKYINAYFKASKQTCLPITEKENLHNKVRDLILDSIYEPNLAIQVRENGMLRKVFAWIEPEFGKLTDAVRDHAREIYIDWTKCTDFTKGSEIIDRWMKFAECDCLPNEENIIVLEKVVEWYPMLSIEQQKEWDNPDLSSSLWIKLFSWVGNLQAEEWLYIIERENLFKKSIK